MERHQISQRVQEAQEFCQALGEYAKENILFEGRTLSEWRREFWIKIPEEVSFSTISKISMHIAAKYQHACYFRDMQNVSLTILEQTQKDKYNEIYHTVRTDHQREHGKMLAAESCRIAAQLGVKDIEDAMANQKIIKDFWTKTCETLIEVRKLLEVSGRALFGDSQLNKDIIIKGRENGN